MSGVQHRGAAGLPGTRCVHRDKLSVVLQQAPSYADLSTSQSTIHTDFQRGEGTLWFFSPTRRRSSTSIHPEHETGWCAFTSAKSL